jgi:hypothetical protein
MAGEQHDQLTCKKCGRTMLADNFYISKKVEIYPTGRVNICKKCLTMHVNNWEPSTFLNILELIDVPYIETEWNALLDKYAKDPKKTSSTAIIGRYLAKMKLKQFKDLTYADTMRIKEETDKKKAVIKAQEDALRNRYSAALQDGSAVAASEIDVENMTDEEIEDAFPQPEEKPISFEDQITQEDKKYLSLKWGKLYQVEEWITMEKLYCEMMESFDIQTPAHKDYLKKICKCSLKMDQAIDCGDVEGFQKLSKVYDSLMKSAKFTAAQNKAESGEFVDSIGEAVTLCEELGFIPKYHTDEPQDVVDVTLKDLKAYSRRLVMDEMNLGNMIEAALQQMQRQEEQEEGELDENDEYLNPDMQEVLEDVDYEEFNEMVDEQSELDASLVMNEVKGEGEAKE